MAMADGAGDLCNMLLEAIATRIAGIGISRNIARRLQAVERLPARTDRKRKPSAHACVESTEGSARKRRNSALH